MKGLHIIGGQQRLARSLLSNDQHWYDYQKGLVVHVDLETGHSATCIEYVSPSEACAAGDPILFKAGTLHDDRLYVCTQTEILIYALPRFEQVGYISLPCFNDVHHVCPTPEGNLLIANSGLEMVLEITPTGQMLREWNVLGEAPWEHFSKTIDYRKGVSTKPHRAHPNYVFFVDRDIWVTRFEQKDALCLTQPDRRIHIGIERVHDGILSGGLLYFTTVNGNVVVANPHTLKVEEVIDLKQINEEGTLLGWCRGILVDDDKIWVGFSRIRPTKFRENVSWVRLGFKRTLPTHVTCYDLRRKVQVLEINMEPYGLNAIFSVFGAAGSVIDSKIEYGERARSVVDPIREPPLHREPERTIP
jgi:hypothetical protein